MKGDPRCPVCHKTAKTRSTNSAYPFCSLRCRAVDLGKWLGEEYRVASRSMEGGEDESPPEPTGDEGNA